MRLVRGLRLAAMQTRLNACQEEETNRLASDLSRTLGNQQII